jgi:hypothetical protein
MLEFTCAGLALDAPIKENFAAQPGLIKSAIRLQVQRFGGRRPVNTDVVDILYSY